jgi:hypothetical protein
MMMLEDSLRNMFADQVQSPPSINDPASVAIRRGRAARRRQTATTSLAAGLALLVTVGGIASLPDLAAPHQGGRDDSVIGFNAAPDQPPSNPTVAPEATADTGIGLDLWAGDRLWTRDGREMSLAGVGAVTRIYRVPTGWVYGGSTEVRFLRNDGTSVALSGKDDRWALSPSGDQIAFVIDTTLYVAHISATGLAVRTRVDVPAGTSPVAFLDQRVVVNMPAHGFDILDPGKPYQPVWNADITSVYGGRGTALAGLVRQADEPRPCLADLRPTNAGLVVDRTGICTPALDGGTTGDGMTQDGRWLVEPRTMDVRLIDLAQAVNGRLVSVECPVRTSVPPTWADDQTLLTADDRGVVRCRTDGSQQVVPLPAGVTARWHFVPKLTATGPKG